MKSEKILSEGMLVPCLMTGSEEWSTAEVIKIRVSADAADAAAAATADEITQKKLYYVHYVDTNKRLDCWVTEDRLDIAKARIKGQEEKEKEKKEEAAALLAGAAANSRCFSPTPAVKDAPASGG